MQIKGRGITKYRAKGEALVCPESFSFLGDVNMETGEIIASDNPNKGETIACKVLVFPQTKGSGSASIILTVLNQNGRAPAAIVTHQRVDTNLVEGTIINKIPIVCNLKNEEFLMLKTGLILEVDGKAGTISWEDTNETTN